MDGETQFEYAFQQQGSAFEQHATNLSDKIALRVVRKATTIGQFRLLREPDGRLCSQRTPMTPMPMVDPA